MLIFFNNKEKKRERKNGLRTAQISFIFPFFYISFLTIYSPNDIFSFLSFSLTSPSFPRFLLIFLLFFLFFSTIAWSTICWQCTTRLPFARTTIPSGAGCGCIQVMNNIPRIVREEKKQTTIRFSRLVVGEIATIRVSGCYA